MAENRNKINVTYFPHPCEKGKKMNYIEDKFKNDGYAVWYKLLELIGKAKNHHINLSNEMDLLYLVPYCGVDEKLLTEIINELVRIGEFNRHLWETKKVLFNQHFIDHIQDAYKRRNNDCITLEEICMQFQIRCIHNGNDCDNDVCGEQQRKEKEIKGKEIKTDYRKILLSELKDSDVDNPDYLKVALSFQELFKNNLKELNMSTLKLEKAKGIWIDPVRLLIENDKYSIQELREVFDFLKTDVFWKKNIRSTEKLRAKFEDLLIRTRSNEKNKSSSGKGCSDEDVAEAIAEAFGTKEN